ncbi:putative transcription factor C2H2 family [Rosa chinensis]|uniref:Putative transcription factor C2H2 family n=1 Tax=Rosa chinensis TaxID=74649 RepID=A0A2P6PR28_ROSCH|nr:uncharacterized protein LOC112169480 isoform X1 [Rosa chinensis]PRQ24375.1 putative transcription factor C2H2 family [Rosa chinensis]
MATMALPEASTRLPLGSLTHIDISTLSQSELHALSLLSLHRCGTDDLVVPKIDRSQFNESAGSRRQTYSRLRRPQSDASTGHRRRVAGLLSTPKVSPPPAQADDPERNENHAIIAHLKHLISQDPKFDQIDLEPTSTTTTMASLFLDKKVGIAELGVRKRKRGRKPKVKGSAGSSGEVLGMQIVNKNGAAVDIWALQNSENPFGDELRRRTLGLETEEELLGFMRELGGQWGSRRKKRKIVDATEFGDALPLGWKLLLGLKRKERRAWIYCRRYISPTGQQFLSCKEVASFLESFFGLNNAERQDGDGDGGENIREDCVMATENHADKDGKRRQDVSSSSAILVSSISNEPENKVSVSEMENLAEVQIHDLFECHKCSMTFAEKDSYLQHLLSFHQRTTRRYRLGSTVGDGVIIKDGKYECQFCHKVFLERRRYNGHVGIHVRNYVRRVEESPAPTTLQKKIESPTREGLLSRNSKMDALIEIAQNSILETSTAGPNEELKGGTTPDPYINISSETPASNKLPSNSHLEMNIESKLTEQDLEDLMIDGINEDEQESEHTITDGSMEEVVDAMEVVDDKVNSCLVTTASSAEEKNGKTSERSVEINGLAPTSDELEMSGTKQENASECPHVHASSNNKSISDVADNVKCAPALEHPSPVEVDKQKHTEPIGSIVQPQPANDSSLEFHASNRNELQSGVCDTSMSLVRPLLCLPTSNAILQKGDEHLIGVGQSGDHVMDLEDLQQHEIEHLKHGSAAGQESFILEEVPIDMTNSSEMQKPVGSSVQFEPEEVMLNMAGSNQLTTACIWCGVDFKHEAVDYDVQPDSVGFMCPVCKAKISERE